jgi:hypothetical protein
MHRRQRNRSTPDGVLSKTSAPRWTITVLLISAVAFGAPAPANAQFQPQTHIDSLYPTANTNWSCVNGNSGGEPPGPNLFCRTDNADTSYYTDSEDGTHSGDIRNRLSFEVLLEREYDGKTALSMRFQPDPKFTGSGETDIIFQQGPMQSGVLGITWCNDAVEGTNECDQQYARFASHTPDTYTICHETGHAVGLTHGAQANPVQANNTGVFFCMRTPLPPVGDRDASIGLANGTLGSQLDAHYGNQ